MRWVMYRRPLAGVFEFGFCANGESESKVKGAGRRPAVRNGNGEKNDVALCAKQAICAA